MWTLCNVQPDALIYSLPSFQFHLLFPSNLICMMYFNYFDCSQNKIRVQMSLTHLSVCPSSLSSLSFSQFVAQPNCQQLLASRWYDEFPGWRRRHWAVKLITCIFIGLLFPLLSIVYLISPKSRYGLFIRKPFIKFICHTASYLTFLLLLFLSSQHIASLQANFQGPPPTIVEWMILPWVLGNSRHAHKRTNKPTNSCYCTLM